MKSVSCKICAEEFFIPALRGRPRLTCSDACKEKRAEMVAARRPKRPYVRVSKAVREDRLCRLCGKGFRTTMSRQTFCSQACSRRASDVKKRFGLTAEELASLEKGASGKCQACGSGFTSTPHVDHCHETGVVRGLLCQGCNLAAGHLKSQPDRAIALAFYLAR